VSEYPDTSFAKDARAILRTIDRKEMQGLPEVAEFLESLPPAEPPRPKAAEEEGSPVKSVSSPRTLD
jgi:hypothetical protein